MINALLVDDDPEYCRVLEEALRFHRSQIKLTGIFNDASTILADIAARRPDVVLMDIFIRDDQTAGIKATKEICAHYPSLPVLILTADEQQNLTTIQDSFRAGAVGYISKDNTRPHQLIEYLEDVMRGGGAIPPDIARRVINGFLPIQQGIRITPREFQVLDLLAHDHDRKAIANELDMSVASVDDHTGNLRMKFNVRTLYGLVGKAYRKRILQI